MPLRVIKGAKRGQTMRSLQVPVTQNLVRSYGNFKTYIKKWNFQQETRPTLQNNMQIITSFACSLRPRIWRGITANKVKMCDDISNFSDDICNLYYDTYILTDENYNLHDC